MRDIPPPPQLVAVRLNPDEAERLGSYRRPADQWRLLLGRTILRRALADDHGIPRADIVLTGKGKPVLGKCHPERLDFSITHDSTWVAVGIAPRGRIGIDISALTNFQCWSEFANQYLAPAELLQISNLPGPEAPLAAARFWTTKEAILKATGHGLETDPRSIVLELAPVPVIRHLPGGLPPPEQFHIEQSTQLEGCHLAVAHIHDDPDP